MSISALSSGSSYFPVPPQNAASAIRQDFKQLSQALQTGDLTAAQAAYSKLEKALTANQPSPSTQTTSSANAAKLDFSNLGRALTAGDLNGAQSAFTQLSRDLAAAKQAGGAPGVGRRHHQGSPPAGDKATGGDSDGDSGGSAYSAAAGSSSGSTISLLG